MGTSGNVMIHVGEYLEYIRECHDSCGGYHEYIGQYH